MTRRWARWFYYRWLEGDTALTRLLKRRWFWVQRIAFFGVLALYPIFCALSWLRIGIRRLLRLKPAVLWAPTPIINMEESSRVLKQLGYSSTSLVYTVYHIRSDF